MNDKIYKIKSENDEHDGDTIIARSHAQAGGAPAGACPVAH